MEGLKALRMYKEDKKLSLYTHIINLNLLYPNNAFQSVCWWRLMVEEFAPKEIRPIGGEDNAAAKCVLGLEHGTPSS